MLKKIREKPHHIKQAISLSLTIIIFFGILFVWVSSWDARAREVEVKEKMLSPVTGVTSVFNGLISGFNKKISERSIVQNENTASSTITGDTFDISGVVILDPSSNTTTVSTKK